MTPQTGSATAGQAGGEDEEIDWKRVDTDDLEREAIASTPGSSQRTDQGAASKLGKSGDGTSFTERLRGAVEDGVGKRKRDEEMDLSTPKQGDVVNGEVIGISVWECSSDATLSPIRSCPLPIPSALLPIPPSPPPSLPSTNFPSTFTDRIGSSRLARRRRMGSGNVSRRWRTGTGSWRRG